jgi:sugar/nucleoside kinase (ribokinase family)
MNTAALDAEVVCVGPIFLDVSIAGLPGMPAPGEELFTTRGGIAPGGIANVAVGLKRLGHDVALVTPRAGDAAGEVIATMLAANGITWSGPLSARTPVTAVLSTSHDRAMATIAPGDDDVQLLQEATRGYHGRALVSMMGAVPTGTDLPRTYLLNSARTANRFRHQPLPPAHAILANAAEAYTLTGAEEPVAAARILAAHADTAVVTLGAGGALAKSGGETVSVPALPVTVHDTTGAGNFFAAAYISADLAGLGLAERLRWATTYASLSTQADTGFASAPLLRDLRQALDTADQTRSG